MFLGFIYFLICNNRKSTHFRINGNKNKQKEQKKKKRKKANLKIIWPYFPSFVFFFFLLPPFLVFIHFSLSFQSLFLIRLFFHYSFGIILLHSADAFVFPFLYSLSEAHISSLPPKFFFHSLSEFLLSCAALSLYTPTQTREKHFLLVHISFIRIHRFFSFLLFLCLFLFCFFLKKVHICRRHV